MNPDSALKVSKLGAQQTGIQVHDRDAGDVPDASLGLLQCASGDPMLASLSLRALL